VRKLPEKYVRGRGTKSGAYSLIGCRKIADKIVGFVSFYLSLDSSQLSPVL
jgi:hypothetical protein